MKTDLISLDRNLGKVLVVDDEILHVRQASEVLEDAGWTVNFACEPASAINKFRTEAYDVLLLDLFFASRTAGFELLVKLRSEAEELGRPIPFAVILTGHGDAKTRLEASKHPGILYREKPLSDLQLVSTFEEVVRTLHDWRSVSSLQPHQVAALPWTEELNIQRIQLLEKGLRSDLSLAESELLKSLQAKHCEWLEGASPFDFSLAREALSMLRAIPPKPPKP